MSTSLSSSLPLSRRLQRRASRLAPNIEVQFAVSRRGIPHPRRLREWAEQALLASAARAGNQPRSLTLRIVGSAEGRTLNRQWRSKDKPTNVLSFPMEDALAAAVDAAAPLGDIVICAPVIRREAKEQSKAADAHWAHMVVHGTLHLLGYDHEIERDAAAMERLEVRVLAGLGFPDPYFPKDAVSR